MTENMISITRPSAAAATAGSPDWQDESWLARYPRVTVAERDRRFDLAHNLMDRLNLQCLILASPPEGHDSVGHYFANEARPTVVLPRTGNPVAFQDSVTLPTARDDFEVVERHFGDRWISDWRFNEGAQGIVELLRNWDLADARIGCTGLRTLMWGSSHIINGGSPWNPVPPTHEVSKMLPNAELVDIWFDFLPLMMVKGPEELEQFKKASHLAQRASDIFHQAVKIGGSQVEAMAEAAYDVLRHGGSTPSIGCPYTSAQTLRGGDIVTGEIVVHVGATEAQAGWTVCLGEPSRTMTVLMDAVKESIELGFTKAAPGMTLGELQEIMEEPFMRIDARSAAPLFHGLNPVGIMGTLNRNLDDVIPALRTKFFPELKGEVPYAPVVRPDIKLQPGMTIHLEPNARKGPDRVALHGNMLITAGGCERYSTDQTVRIKV